MQNADKEVMCENGTPIPVSTKPNFTNNFQLFGFTVILKNTLTTGIQTVLSYQARSACVYTEIASCSL